MKYVWLFQLSVCMFVIVNRKTAKRREKRQQALCNNGYLNLMLCTCLYHHICICYAVKVYIFCVRILLMYISARCSASAVNVFSVCLAALCVGVCVSVLYKQISHLTRYAQWCHERIINYTRFPHPSPLGDVNCSPSRTQRPELTSHWV